MSSPLVLMPGPMFFAVPQRSSRTSYVMYQRSLPPCPPGMSEANTKIEPSGLNAGCPTWELSFSSRLIRGTSSAGPKRVPIIGARYTSQAKADFLSSTHRVKYIILNFGSKVTVPSLNGVFTVLFNGSGTLHLPFLSAEERNKSMKLSPVMGSSPDPVEDSREEAKMTSSPFFAAKAKPKS